MSPAESSVVLEELSAGSAVVTVLESELLPSASLDEVSAVEELVASLEPLDVLEFELVELVLPSEDDELELPVIVVELLVVLDVSDSDPTSPSSSGVF